MEIKRRGIMFAISSPSGAGKTSLCRLLLENRRLNLTLSVSVTTRPQRANEVDGKDYHFVSKEKFDSMLKAGELIEHAQVFSNWYGTPREPVEETLDQGCDILFDIDWQGVRQLAQYSKKDLVTIFLLPPSGEELQRRLEARALDTEDTIRERMKMASEEIDHYDEYDYVLMNRDLEISLEEAQAILLAEQARQERQTDLGDLVKGLQKEL